MDYIAYDPSTGYVWVPAINVGSVDVVDTSTGSVREISGFATNEVEFGGRKRTQGPSGVSVVRVWYTSAIEPIPACALSMEGHSRAKAVDTSIQLPTALSMSRQPRKSG